MINYFSLYLSFFISILFFSTSYTKLKSFNKHMYSINMYNIIPGKFIKLFAIIDIFLEFITSILLSLNFLFHFDVLLICLILITYCIAIIHNIKKGNSEMNCGCGGFLGDQQLSWKIVYRNMLLLIISVFLLIDPSNFNFFSFDHNMTYFLITILIFGYSFISIFIFNILGGFLELNKFIKKI